MAKRKRAGCLLWAVGAVAVVFVIVALMPDEPAPETRQAPVLPVATFTPTASAERSAPVVIPLDTPAPAPVTLPVSTDTPAPLMATPTPEPPTVTPLPVLPTDTATLVPVPTTCECYDDLYNCDDFPPAFIKGDTAQACYQHCMATVGFDVHKLDRDKDGGACEWQQ